MGITFKNNKSTKEKETSEINIIEVLQPLDTPDSAKAVNQTLNNIVKITNKISDKKIVYATWFFYESGYLVTNSHVVDIKGEITIEYPDGSVIPAQIYSNEIKSDIALLIVDDVKIKALPLKSTIDLEITDEV